MVEVSDEDVQVRDEPEKSRYAILVGDQAAGFAQYTRHGTETDFVHTEIDEQFSGRGLASRLIRAALDDSRAQARQVLPHCPFVRNFIAKNADYLQLVPAARRAEFELTSAES